MLAAISASENNNDVTIIEKNNTLGKKLLITGKGRCNITSSLSISEFINNIPGNGNFLYSAFNSFTNQDIIELLKEQGLDVKEERGNRIFPVTDSAKDVLNCLEKKLKQLNVKILLNKTVDKIVINSEKEVTGIMIKDEIIKCDKVILATGGKSYPLTGSTGDGYKMASELGHSITRIKPSLVPMETYEKNLHGYLQGLSLKNVRIKIIDNSSNKQIYDDFGEMLFTHFGVSGPIILSGSSHLVRYKNIDELLSKQKIELVIDLKPALSEEKLNLRILRDFEENKNKSFKNGLDKLLPQKIIPVIIKLSKIKKKKKVNSITKDERIKLVKTIKNFKLTLKDFRKIDEAIITSGGVDIKEVNPRTMESKLINGLFFAGEVLDVDGYTGGFNLQIAYSTGFVAGQ